MSVCSDMPNHMHMRMHLTEVPGLWMVETVDSYRSAKALNQRWGDRREKSFSGSDSPLHVMLQVNTSREESKSNPSSRM